MMMTVELFAPPRAHTVNVPVENVTGLPDAPPVADTVNAGAPSGLSAGCGKTMTCAPLVTLKLVDTAGAAL